MKKKSKQDRNLDRLSTLIDNAGELDAEVKAKTVVLDQLKAEIRELVTALDLPPAEEIRASRVALKYRHVRSLNKVLAYVKYGKRVTERVVTPAAVKAAGLTQAEMDSIYEDGTLVLTFSHIEN